ncbi:hypothetical protein HK405_002975, partial [Cladochytrium tenue]
MTTSVSVAATTATAPVASNLGPRRSRSSDAGRYSEGPSTGLAPHAGSPDYRTRTNGSAFGWIPRYRLGGTRGTTQTSNGPLPALEHDDAAGTTVADAVRSQSGTLDEAARRTLLRQYAAHATLAGSAEPTPQLTRRPTLGDSDSTVSSSFDLTSPDWDAPPWPGSLVANAVPSSASGPLDTRREAPYHPPKPASDIRFLQNSLSGHGDAFLLSPSGYAQLVGPPTSPSSLDHSAVLEDRPRLALPPTSLPQTPWANALISRRPGSDTTTTTAVAVGPRSAPVAVDAIPVRRVDVLNSQAASNDSLDWLDGLSDSNLSAKSMDSLLKHDCPQPHEQSPRLRRSKASLVNPASQVRHDARSTVANGRGGAEPASLSYTSVNHDDEDEDEDEDEDVSPISGIVSSVWRRTPDFLTVAPEGGSRLAEIEAQFHREALARLDGLHRASPAPPAGFLHAHTLLAGAHGQQQQHHQSPLAAGLARRTSLSGAPALAPIADGGGDENGIEPNGDHRALQDQRRQSEERRSRAEAAATATAAAAGYSVGAHRRSFSAPSPLSRGRHDVASRGPLLPLTEPGPYEAAATAAAPGRKAVRWADATPRGELAVFHEHDEYVSLVERIRERRIEALVFKRIAEQHGMVLDLAGAELAAAAAAAAITSPASPASSKKPDSVAAFTSAPAGGTAAAATKQKSRKWPGSGGSVFWYSFG